MADIWAFIAEDSPVTATAFLTHLQGSFLPLLDNPWLGPARDELSPGLRVHFFRKYAIYYMPTDRDIVIIRVVRGSQDRDALFSES